MAKKQTSDGRSPGSSSTKPGAVRQVYEEIKEMILSLHIDPGAIVSEKKLADRLGTSRTPVREALKRLEQEGLIFIKNRRKRVYILTIEDVIEIFDLKKVVEGTIARWAAERGSEEDRERLAKIVGRMAELAKTKSSNAEAIEVWNAHWIEIDKHYHDTIAKMAGNKRAGRFIINLNAQWHRLRLGILAIEDRIEKSLVEHTGIANAILETKPEEAEKLMREHLENLKVMLTGIMKAFHFPQSSTL